MWRNKHKNPRCNNLKLSINGIYLAIIEERKEIQNPHEQNREFKRNRQYKQQPNRTIPNEKL